MSEHKKRFTLEKIKSRYQLIEPLAVRERVDIKELKCFALENAMEQPVLDAAATDKSFGVLHPPCYWGQWNANFSMTGSFTVPAAWREQGQVAMMFDLGSTPRWDLCHPEALLYVDEQPIAAVDLFHKTVYLPVSVCDGKEHHFALHLFTGRWGYYDRKPPYKLFMETCALVSIDKATVDYLATVRTALGTVEALEQEALAHSRLLNALDASFLVLNTLHPLKDSFYDSVPAAHETLKQEIKKAGPAMDVNVFALGHSHIDVAWLWPLEQTRRKCGRSFHTILALMEDHPDFVFTQSQPQLYDYVRQDYPTLFQCIQERVTQGQWETVGGMWVEADCNLTGAESLARQFLLGRSFFAEFFGPDAESPILWLPDVFGYSANLPQLIKQAGLEYFFTIKLSWSQYNKMPYDSFWWQGLDGTKVLTHLGSTRESFDAAVTYNSLATPAESYHTWKYARQKESHTELMTCFGHGDGGGGPTREMLENIREMQDFPGLPRLKHAKAIDFFRALEQASGDRLPTWVGELYFEYHRGTYTSQAKNKRNNRKSEFGLHDVEFLSALAARLDAEFSYPHAALREAWQLICLNQFHDIIPGSSIPEVYVDSDRDYARIAAIVQDLKKQTLKSIAASTGGDVLILNPSSFTRQDPALLPGTFETSLGLETTDGHLCNTQVTEEGLLIDTPTVASYGMQSLKVVDPGPAPATGLQVSKTCLENKYIKVQLSAEGDITSIFDKVHQRETVAPDHIVNQILAFEDRPMAWDAWDIDIFYDDKVFACDPAASIEVIEQGPLRACIEIKRSILSSFIRQRISLSHNSARLDFVTEVDWQERCVLLKSAFPVDLLNAQASFEIQWGHVKRPTHHNTSWDWAKFETCAQKWVDLSETDYGVSLLNDCKYGHDIKDNVMRITLLRGATMPDPDADLGTHRFTYSLLPHEGPLAHETIQQGYALNDPLIVHHSNRPHENSPHPFSLFSLDQDGVFIETVKQAEDGRGIIVRLYEALGTRRRVTLTAGMKLQSCAQVNLLEAEQATLPIEGSAVHFDIHPFEIVSLCLVGVD